MPIAEMTVDGDRIVPTGREITLAWQGWDGGPTAGPNAPPERMEKTPVVFLHGSPGGAGNFWLMIGSSVSRRRAIAPDLPGFGASEHRVADYSIRAHAAEVFDWLDRLGVDRVHLVGFSMGGGVGLEMVRQQEERVASLALLASIGVQELELFGNYRLNHLLHGLQLGAIWAAGALTPHFGLFDQTFLDRSYARNFYDTDQRPLRSVLQKIEVPVLIIHGKRDPLVPVAAAEEHARLAPQAELVVREDSHFFVFSGETATAVGEQVAAFHERVDRGEARTRNDVSAVERQRALEEMDPSIAAPFTGPALLALVLLLAASTMISEDLTCIVAGLLVAQGRIELLPATLACLAGITVGDMALFMAGRWFGRPLLSLPPLRWWITRDAFERSSAWLRSRGPLVIVMSRFTPGLRLPTYVAAGVLRTSFWLFSLYFLLAASLWTPILVFVASRLGADALERFEGVEWALPLIAISLLVALIVARKLVLPLLTHRGRRTLVGRWLRLKRFEFWPIGIFYLPLLPWFVGQAIKHKSWTVFTAVNPMMPAGGFIGESKKEIFTALGPSAHVPPWSTIPRGATVDQAVQDVERFRTEQELEWPLILKPDAGQRGQGVSLVASTEEVRQYFERRERSLTLVQKYVGGVEYGVFWYRLPGEERGRVFSITEKEVPRVTGDGQRSIADLVLDHPRFVALATVYLRDLGERAQRVPAAGEVVSIQEIGAHSRGTVFKSGTHHLTPQLADAIEQVSLECEGFDFGRYDVRVPSLEHLRSGQQLSVIELNGVTSESTDLYDPLNSLLDAYRILLRQWQVAFEIGARRRALGHRPASPLSLLRAWMKFRRGEPI